MFIEQTNWGIWSDQGAPVLWDVVNDPAWPKTGEVMRILPMSDPDGDGHVNAVERFCGSGLFDASSTPDFSLGASGFEYVRMKDAPGMIGRVKWSGDLASWSDQGIQETILEDLGDRERVAASVSHSGRIFYSLHVSPEPLLK